MSEASQEDTLQQEDITKICALCSKEGTGFPKCGRCKDVYYCSRQCQQKDWKVHKDNCIRPEDRPKPPSEEAVVEYVECATYEDCRECLIKHPEIISKQTSDEMFQKGWLALKSHPVEIGTRFIRNAQILQYLLDLRKASNGQQDIGLFFHRILDENNPEYRRSFDKEYQELVVRIIKRIKEKELEKQKEQGASAENTDK